MTPTVGKAAKAQREPAGMHFLRRLPHHEGEQVDQDECGEGQEPHDLLCLQASAGLMSANEHEQGGLNRGQHTRNTSHRPPPRRVCARRSEVLYIERWHNELDNDNESESELLKYSRFSDYVS